MQLLCRSESPHKHVPRRRKAEDVFNGKQQAGVQKQKKVSWKE
jgi:hypothetical protein